MMAHLMGYLDPLTPNKLKKKGKKYVKKVEPPLEKLSGSVHEMCMCSYPVEQALLVLSESEYCVPLWSGQTYCFWYGSCWH